MITQGGSVCAAECGRAAGQAASKASLSEHTKRKRRPNRGHECLHESAEVASAAGSSQTEPRHPKAGPRMQRGEIRRQICRNVSEGGKKKNNFLMVFTGSVVTLL